MLAAHAELSAPGTGQFARILVVQRRYAGGVATLRGCLLTNRGVGGTTETVLDSWVAWRGALGDGTCRSTTSTRTSSGPSTSGCGRPTSRGRQPDRPRVFGMAELLEIADELYGLSLPEFTPARDARAKELKGTPLAAQVKALRKPSTAAWVVNLLVRRETEQVEQVLAVGAALREAQASMSGDELRALTRQRRQLTAAVTTQARGSRRTPGPG